MPTKAGAHKKEAQQMRKLSNLTLAISLAFSASIYAETKKDELAVKTIFKNVNIFNGTKEKLITGCNVIVVKNLIKDACAKQVKATKSDIVIDGKGQTLMPGLIDAHTHLTIIENTPGQTLQREWTYIGAAAGRESELMLNRGFTTVRDAGGPATGLRKAIDDGRAKAALDRMVAISCGEA